MLALKINAVTGSKDASTVLDMNSTKRITLWQFKKLIILLINTKLSRQKHLDKLPARKVKHNEHKGPRFVSLRWTALPLLLFSEVRLNVLRSPSFLSRWMHVKQPMKVSVMNRYPLC